MSKFLLYVLSSDTASDPPIQAGDLMGPYVIRDRVEPCLDACELFSQDSLKPCCPWRRHPTALRPVPNARPKWKSASVSKGMQLPLTRDVTDEGLGYGRSDVAPVNSLELSRVPIPTAIITPDGEWHEAGETTFDGADTESWPDTARRILKSHHDAILVALDCSADDIEETEYYGIW